MGEMALAFATRDPGVDFTRIYPFVTQEER